MIRYLRLLSVLIISFSCEKQTISTPTTKPSPTHNPRDVVASSLPAPIKSIIPTPEPTPHMGVDKLPRELLVLDEGYLKVIDKDVKVKTSIYVGGCGFTGFLQNKKVVLDCTSKTLIADLDKQTSQELKDEEGNNITNVGISEDKTKIYSPVFNYDAFGKVDIKISDDMFFQNRKIYSIGQNELNNIKAIKTEGRIFTAIFSNNKIAFIQKYSEMYSDYDLSTINSYGGSLTKLFSRYISDNVFTYFYENIIPLKISFDEKYVAIMLKSRNSVIDKGINIYGSGNGSKIFIFSSDGKQTIDTNYFNIEEPEWLDVTHDLIFLKSLGNNNYDLVKFNVEEKKSSILETNVWVFKVLNQEKKIYINSTQGSFLLDFDGKNKTKTYKDYPVLLSEVKLNYRGRNNALKIINEKTQEIIQLPEPITYENYEYSMHFKSKSLIDNNFFIYSTDYFNNLDSNPMQVSEKATVNVYSIKDKRNLNIQLDKVFSSSSFIKWVE